MENDYFKDGASNEKNRIKDVFLEGIESEDVSFESSALVGVTLLNSTIVDFELIDSKLERCNFSNTKLKKGYLKGGIMSASKATGLDISEGELKYIKFKDCKIDLANFSFAHFKEVEFHNCVLSGASFQGTDLNKVIFSGCDLTDADFSQSKIYSVDLRGSNVNGVMMDISNFKNLTVDPLQAVYFASLLGLKIKE